MKKRILSATLSSLVLAACGSSGGGGGGNGAITNPNPPNPTGSSTALTYANVNSQVITPHCVYCHGQAGGNQGGVNLETYPNVLNRHSTVRADVVSGSMPQDHRLPTNLEKMLVDWIDVGAPQ